MPISPAASIYLSTGQQYRNVNKIFHPDFVYFTNSAITKKQKPARGLSTIYRKSFGALRPT